MSMLITGFLFGLGFHVAGVIVNLAVEAVRKIRT